MAGMTTPSEPSPPEATNRRERALKAIAGSMVQLADVVTGWRVEEFGDVRAVCTGLPVAFLNTAMLPLGLHAGVADLERALDWLAGQHLPYSAQLAIGRDDAAVGSVTARGLVAQATLPGMLLDLDLVAPPPPGGLSVRAVEDEQTRSHYADVLCAGFEMPRELVDPILDCVVPPPAGLGVLTGFLDGVPVATAMASVVGDTVAVFNVTTLPDRRRRGLGLAMTWRAIEYGRAHGCTAAALQSSPDGLGVYTAMGFRDVAPVTVYASA